MTVETWWSQHWPRDTLICTRHDPPGDESCTTAAPVDVVSAWQPRRTQTTSDWTIDHSACCRSSAAPVHRAHWQLTARADLQTYQHCQQDQCRLTVYTNNPRKQWHPQSWHLNWRTIGLMRPACNSATINLWSEMPGSVTVSLPHNVAVSAVMTKSSMLPCSNVQITSLMLLLYLVKWNAHLITTPQHQTDQVQENR